jgi:hypothetical protein
VRPWQAASHVIGKGLEDVSVVWAPHEGAVLLQSAAPLQGKGATFADVERLGLPPEPVILDGMINDEIQGG